MLRRLELVDMDAAARVLRTSFDHALPSLAGLHTPKGDQWFFRERGFTTGVGRELLQVAQRPFDRLHLWTFQRNVPARRFYEARGFALVRETDGAGNEEKEPDALYRWTRS